MNDPRVYFLRALRSNAVKIGTSSDVAQRIASLRAQYGSRLVLIGTIPGDERYEKTLHRAFAEYRIRGEWFRCDGRLAAFLSSLPVLPEDVRPPSKRRIANMDRPVRVDPEMVRAIHRRWLAIFREIVGAVGTKRFALVHGFNRKNVEAVLADKRMPSREMQLSAADIASPEQRQAIANLVGEAIELGVSRGGIEDDEAEDRRYLARVREAILDGMGEEQLAVIEHQINTLDGNTVLARLKFRVAKRFGEIGAEFIEEFEREFPVAINSRPYPAEVAADAADNK